MKLQINTDFLNQNTLLSCLAAAAITQTAIEVEAIAEGFPLLMTM